MAPLQAVNSTAVLSRVLVLRDGVRRRCSSFFVLRSSFFVLCSLFFVL
jgi:hypothetical protein